jgi:hypothetical protein
VAGVRTYGSGCESGVDEVGGDDEASRGGGDNREDTDNLFVLKRGRIYNMEQGRVLSPRSISP